MGTSRIISVMAGLAVLGFTSCEPVSPSKSEDRTASAIPLQDVAILLSELPIGQGQFAEVHDAVNSSSGNGYDEEYTMRDLFSVPGSGVGDDLTKASAKEYECPLRDMITEYLSSGFGTKADGSGMNPEEYIKTLTGSDIQIYWPFSDSWDSETAPVITFDPEDDSEANVGYRLAESADGTRKVEEVIVTEDFAKKNPVWVVNRNEDSDYLSLEMLRRQDPDWGVSGGDIIIGKPTKATSDSDDVLRTLILKDFTSHRNFDCWFAGASELIVKIGSVENFTASTEAELQLYSPSITDFVVVVKRSQVGTKIPFNAVLVSQWTSQLTSCAFLLSEDDGGTQTSWKCSAEVKIKSKTYGFDIELPIRTRDDIIWRGQLSAKYLEKYKATVGHFGDVDITFDIVEI